MLSLDGRCFSVIAGVLRHEAGIDLPPSKTAMVEARIRRRLRELGMVGDYGSYCARLEGADATLERRLLVNAMTTNVTRFFRESHHFDLLAEEAVARLTQDARETLAIWSAGCADGSEAVSALLAIARACPGVDPARVSMLATDIDDDAVAAAAAGIYPCAALDGGLRPHGAAIEPVGEDRFRLAPRWKDRLTARRHNLVGPDPVPERFDAILCRNVMIYFDDDAKARAQTALRGALRPGGLLMIGHSERLSEPHPDLARVGITAFRQTPEGGLT